jgi:hypothetical protein
VVGSGWVTVWPTASLGGVLVQVTVTVVSIRVRLLRGHPSPSLLRIVGVSAFHAVNLMLSE